MSDEAHYIPNFILKLNKLASLSYILLIDYIKMYVQKFQSFVIGLNIRVNRPIIKLKCKNIFYVILLVSTIF